MPGTIGRWRCAEHTCLAKCGGCDDWCNRFLVIPQATNAQTFDVYYIGEVSATDNAMLTSLKAGELTKECRGEEIGNISYPTPCLFLSFNFYGLGIICICVASVFRFCVSIGWHIV